MSPALVTLLTFLAGILLVIGVYSIFSDLYLRDRARFGQRVDEAFRKRQRDRARQSALFKNLPEMASQAAADNEDHTTWRQHLETMLEQTGLDITLRRLGAWMLGVAMGTGLLTIVLFRQPLAALLCAVVAAGIPALYVAAKRQARLKRLLSQLPDAFELMSRVIRAGQTMSQALQAVSDEFDDPIAAEFAYCYEQQNFGLPPEMALRDLARRTGLVELKIFVLAMLVQQQTGGNLAEVLDRLAHLVRERFKMQGKIKALTAEGRFQAIILLALPPVMLLLLMTLNWRYMKTLFDHPLLLVGLFIAESLGALWIRKIARFDF